MIMILAIIIIRRIRITISSHPQEHFKLLFRIVYLYANPFMVEPVSDSDLSPTVSTTPAT